MDTKPAQARATDATIEELVAAADALVDEVEEALETGDTAQVTALLTALDETIDAQMGLLGIPDTDEGDMSTLSARPRTLRMSFPNYVGSRQELRRGMQGADIAALRAEAAAKTPGVVPCGVARSQPFRGEFRAQMVKRDGQDRYHIEGQATVYEQPYEMWDAFGPYKEVMSAGAGAVSLKANPDVAFLTNHRGVTMARTTNGSLQLREDAAALNVEAWLNPQRQDVKDLVVAIEDKDVTEMSFAFMIDDGTWSPDYKEYRINAYDINRGDVSAVNYGANPYTSV
jgi:HK97 family phage prohead protease